MSFCFITYLFLFIYMDNIAMWNQRINIHEPTINKSRTKSKYRPDISLYAYIILIYPMSAIFHDDEFKWDSRLPKMVLL
jgi:hypothetical protein